MHTLDRDPLRLNWTTLIAPVIRGRHQVHFEIPATRQVADRELVSEIRAHGYGGPRPFRDGHLYFYCAADYPGSLARLVGTLRDGPPLGGWVVVAATERLRPSRIAQQFGRELSALAPSGRVDVAWEAPKRTGPPRTGKEVVDYHLRRGRFRGRR